MPYILSNGGSPTLSLELGYSSVFPLGLDIISVDNAAERTERLQRLRAAIGHMCDNVDSDVQIVRSKVDETFALDSENAPVTFPFNVGSDESITAMLASSTDDELFSFVLWNHEHCKELRAELITNLPSLQSDSEARTARLYNAGILPKIGVKKYELAVGGIVKNRKIGPLDSFEGAQTDGIRNELGIFLHNPFNGGYGIGSPTKKYYHGGFHEIGHEQRAGSIFRTGSNQLITEFIIEHVTALSNPDGNAVHESPLLAANRGGYRTIRKLFGSLLEYGPHQISAEQFGEALITPGWGLAYRGVTKAVRQNFNHFFPGDESPFRAFAEEQDACTFGHQSIAVTKKWLGAVHTAAGIEHSVSN